MCHLLCLSCCPGFLFGSPWIQYLPGHALVSCCLREGEEVGREGEPPWQGSLLEFSAAAHVLLLLVAGLG